VLNDALFAGVPNEDIQLDVGHCQRSCRGLFSLIDPDFADLESSVFKVSLASMNHHAKEKTIKLNSVALVRERTIPTERPPLVGEVSANFCG
jgi:hypothetical protein